MVVMVFVLVILEEMMMMIMVAGPMVEIERGANMEKWVILLLGSLETGKCN